VIDLYRASEYARLHHGKIMVFKVGGACLAKPGQRAALARQIGVITAFGVRAVLVHGAGPQTDAVQSLLGEQSQKIDGRRVTTVTGLRALRMASMGEVNGALVANLTNVGAPAVGVCAASANIVVAKRRPPMKTSEGMIDFGEVGDVVQVNPGPLLALAEAGTIPVVAPPASDGAEGFFNINADSVAAELAVALNADKLVLISDTPGILSDPSDSHSLLSSLSLDQLGQLEAQGALQGGMAVKAACMRRALDGGVPLVHVVSGLAPDALLGELYTTQGTGTLVSKESPAVMASSSSFTDLPQGV
jgi:acetylglutamate kinase